MLAAAMILVGVQTAPASAIVGGAPAAYGQVPYEVAIDNPDGTLDCAGSIIDQTHVLTAAHCVANLTGLLGNLGGGLLGGFAVRYDSLDYATGGTVDPVTKITVHPGYNPLFPQDYDLAVLRLANPIAYGTEAQPIALPAQDSPGPVPGMMALTAGWGPTQPTGPDSHALQYANVPVQSASTCTKYFHMTDRMICAGGETGQESSCPGDSGGPLAVNGKLVGIVSYGPGCGVAAPAVYVNVASVRQWITDNARI